MRDIINIENLPKGDFAEVKEVEIPVPWGYICGKWWGPKNLQPIIGIHGWQDNSGSFDKLAPYLVDYGFSFLCIDLPGHGFSSHFPKGVVYNHSFDGVYCVRRIVKYFGWEKIILIGHSLGGSITFLYASIFPNDVAKFISLDNCGPRVRNPQTLLPVACYNMDQLFEYENNKFYDLCYGYEEMLDIMMEGHNGSLDREACEILMKRGMKPSPDKQNCYVFTRDPRLKIVAFPFFSMDEIRDFASRITCEVLNIRADQGTQLEQPEHYDLTVDAIERSAKRVERVYLKGKHHIHLTDVETVAPIVLNFLLSTSEVAKTHNL
ncbi:probable serine hydrolase [Diorhabda carinulata]|uniref:probable serine hydrolase n=1 Tax=Diorhabda carinulata TaxID=1163345 RepID=UPI0025A05193|nr:probable serine hydrolase [Diorhabda carinulata]